MKITSKECRICSPHRRPTVDDLNKQVDAWNRHRPIGTKVLVRKDDGSVLETTTRSLAWLMGGHSAMIMVEGIAGGYRLDRVKPI